jgi:selenophosphate synthetase-related protein
MVNLSDIAVMGGRAAALIDQVWAPDADAAAPLLAGLQAASEAFGVPIVGGHTNFEAGDLALAVSVFGRAVAPISGAAARPGDELIATVDHRGAWLPRFDNWCAAQDSPPDPQRGDLALPPALAEDGLVAAGKHISQGGIVGAAVMLAEASGVGIDIDLARVARPAGADLERWLRAFPSFGFLLSVAPADADAVFARFHARGIAAGAIGAVTRGSAVRLSDGADAAPFWDHAATPYLSLSPAEAADA